MDTRKSKIIGGLVLAIIVMLALAGPAVGPVVRAAETTTMASTIAVAAAPTSAPTPPTVMTGTVKSKSGNVRAGPGTGFQVVATVKAGDKLNLTGRTSDSAWLQVCCYKNAPAWISASLVTPSGKLASLPVPKNIPQAAAAAVKQAAKAGAPQGVLVFSVVNWDADRWEMKQYSLANGETKFLGEWRTEVAFSRDYKQIVYFGWPNVMGDRPGIYIANPDMSGERMVILGGYYPSFSPGGDRLSAQGGDSIYILNTDGSGLRELVPGEYPAWSPVDNWIAHRGCYGPECGLWITHADSGERQRLTTGGGDGQPAWSPDGKRIVFISKDDGNFELYVINRDGSGKTRLTNDPHSDGLPVWSPDGGWIAFRSDRSGTWAIYVMRPDGSDVRKLIDADVFPLWFLEKMAWRP